MNIILQYLNNNKWYTVLGIISVNIITQLFKLMTYRNITSYISEITKLLTLENAFLTFFIKLFTIHLIQNIGKFILEYVISIGIRDLFRNIIKSIINNSNFFIGKDTQNKINQIWLYLNNLEIMMTKLLIDLPIIITFIVYYIYIMYSLYSEALLYITPINLFMIFILRPFSKKQYKLQKEKINLDLKTKNKLLETVSNIEFVKLNNREDYEINRIDISYKKYFLNKITNKWIEFYMSFLYQIYNDFLIIIIYSMGITYIIKKTINPFDLIYLAINTGTFCYHVTQLKDIYNYYKRINPKLKIIQKLLNFKKEHTELNDGSNIKDNQLFENIDIEFKKVTFSYDGIFNVINDINFKFTGNKINILLGSNGSGKSTLIKLLLRLYNLLPNENNNNKIFYKGIDINDFNIKKLREEIVFVSQEPYLFNESIIYNIKYGNETIQDNKIKELCDEIYLSEWLLENMNLCAGFRGRNLSGGEKKKIQLINAICKDGKVIIFDEPTNTLDLNAIKWFINFIQLLKNKFNKTIVIITHDIRLKEVADHIIDLNKII